MEPKKRELAMNEKMNVGEICNRTVVFGYRHMDVSEAARLMHEQHVGSIVVVEETENGRMVVGMLTDRDICTGIVARDLDAKNVRVGDIMSESLITVRPRDSVNDTLKLMSRHGVRRIPVTNVQEVLVGIVSMDDLLEIVAEELHDLVQTIKSEKKREISGKSRPNGKFHTTTGNSVRD
jgi:CBS domain-containing protein